MSSLGIQTLSFMLLLPMKKAKHSRSLLEKARNLIEGFGVLMGHSKTPSKDPMTEPIGVRDIKAPFF